MFPQLNQGSVQQEYWYLRISSIDLGRSRLVPSVSLIFQGILSSSFLPEIFGFLPHAGEATVRGSFMGWNV